MHVTLVGYDKAPSESGTLLAQQLVEKGHMGKTFFAHGKPPSFDCSGVWHDVSKTDVLWCGMSSPEYAAIEFAAIEKAERNGVPVVLFADAYSAYKRAHVLLPKTHVAGMAVINEIEADAARKLHPHLKILATGVPSWEAYAYPKWERSVVRRELDIPDDIFIVMCAGCKTVSVDLHVFGMACSALALLSHEAEIIFCPHPGGDPDDLNYYHKAAQESPCRARVIERELGEGRETFPDQVFMPSSKVLVSVDLIVDAFSSIGIEAGFQHKPVINVGDDVTLTRRMEVNKSTEWHPNELGASERFAGTSLELARRFEALRTKEGFAKMRSAQEHVYTKPLYRGQAADKLIQLLEKVVSERDPQIF